MTEQEKAKILLQYGSYEKYIFLLLDKNELGSGTTAIEDMLREEFSNLVDPEDIAEELRSHEDPDVTKDDIDECSFESWDQAWDFYEDNVIEEVVQQMLKVIDIDDHDLVREVYKVVEEEAKDMIF